MAHKQLCKIKVPLADGEVVEIGDTACIDRAAGASQGQAVASRVATGLIPIGRFAEHLTGDGAEEVEIELFSTKIIHWFKNDGTIAPTDLLGPAYFTASNTVGVPADPAPMSLAGRVWIVDSWQVGIDPADSCDG